jgi:hypothetical protein
MDLLYSSVTMKRRNLARVPDGRARRFLLDFANLSDESVERDTRVLAAIEERYKDIIPNKWLVTLQEDLIARTKRSGLLLLIDPRNIVLSARPLRDAIRAIWIASDSRTKEWGVFRLIESATTSDTNVLPDVIPAALSIKDGRVAPIQPETPFERCMRYLLLQGTRPAVCANANCPGPYFFARRRSQKYCSEDCALPAQRQFKREWWAKNGRQWRSQRRSVK